MGIMRKAWIVGSGEGQMESIWTLIMNGWWERTVSKVFRDFSPGWLGGANSGVKNKEHRRSATTEGKNMEPILGMFSPKDQLDFSVQQTMRNGRSQIKKAWCLSHVNELLNSWNGMRSLKKNGEKESEDRTEFKGKKNNREGKWNKNKIHQNLRVKELGPSPIFFTQASAVAAHIGMS